MVDTFTLKKKLILNITPFRPYTENSLRFGDVTSTGISAVVSLQFHSTIHSPTTLPLLPPSSVSPSSPEITPIPNFSSPHGDNKCMYVTTLVFETIQIHGSSIFSVGSVQIKLCETDSSENIIAIAKASCVCRWHFSGQHVLVNVLNRMFLFSLKWSQYSSGGGGVKGSVSLSQVLAASISTIYKFGGEDDSSAKIDDRAEEWHPIKIDITYEGGPVPGDIPIYTVVNLNVTFTSNASSELLGIVTDDKIICTSWTDLKEIGFLEKIRNSLSISNQSEENATCEGSGAVSQFTVELWRVTKEEQRFDFGPVRLSAKGSTVAIQDNCQDDRVMLAPVSAVEFISHVVIEGNELLLVTLSDGSLSILKAEGASESNSSRLDLSKSIGIQIHPVFSVSYVRTILNDERVITPTIRTSFEVHETKVKVMDHQKNTQDFVYEEISRVLCVKVLGFVDPSNSLAALLLISTCHMPSEAIDAAIHQEGDKSRPVMDHNIDASGLLQVPRQESLSLMEVLLTQGDSNDHINLRCTQWTVVKTRIWRSNKERTKSDDMIESIQTMAGPSLSVILVSIDGIVTGISRENFKEILFTVDTFCLTNTVSKSPVCEVMLTRRLIVSVARGCILLAVSEMKELSQDLTVGVASFLHVVQVLLPLKSCDPNLLIDGRQQQRFWIDLVNLTMAVQDTAIGSLLDTTRTIPLLLHSARLNTGHWRTVKLPKQLLLQLTRDCIVDHKSRFVCTKNDAALPFLASSSSQCIGSDRCYGSHGKIEFIAWMDERCWVRVAKAQKDLPLYYMVLWVHNSATGRWKGIDLSLIGARNFIKRHPNGNFAGEKLAKKLFESEEDNDTGYDGSTHETNGKDGAVAVAIAVGVSSNSTDDIPAEEGNDVTNSVVRDKRPCEGSIVGAPNGSPRPGNNFPPPRETFDFTEELKLSSFQCKSVRWLDATTILLITSRGQRNYIEVLSKDCLPSSGAYGPYQRGSLRKSSKHVLFEISLRNEPQLLELMFVDDLDGDTTQSINGTTIRKHNCLISDGIEVIVVEIGIHLSSDESQGSFSIANHILKFSVHQLWRSPALDTVSEALTATEQPRILDAKLWTTSNGTRNKIEKGGLHVTTLMDSGIIQIFHIVETSQVHLLASGPQAERNAKITSIASVDMSHLRSHHSHSAASDVEDEYSHITLINELIFCLADSKEVFAILQYEDSEGNLKYIVLPFDHVVHANSLDRGAFALSRQNQTNGTDIRAAIVFDLFQSAIKSLIANGRKNRSGVEPHVLLKLLKTLIAPLTASNNGKNDRSCASKGTYVDFHGLAQLIEFRFLEMMTTQQADTQQQLHFRAVCGVLWTFNQTLFCEVMSKLCRKLDPSLSRHLFPVSVPETTVGLSVLRLFELSLEGGRLLQSARFLSSACESVGGSSSHISAVASFILALEFFLQCALKMSLKLGRDTLEFCLRIETAIKLHCKMIFGTYTTRKGSSSEGPPNSDSSQQLKGNKEDRRVYTLDGSYIKTVKLKAFRLIDNARVESVDDRCCVEKSLLTWLLNSARDYKEGESDSTKEVRTKRVYENTYYPGKGIISAVSDIIEWAATTPRKGAQENGQNNMIDSVFQPVATRKIAMNEGRGKDAFKFYKAISIARSACGEQQFTNALSGGGPVEASVNLSLTMCTVAAAIRSMLDTGSHYYTATVLITSLLKSEPFVATLRQYLRCRLIYLEFNNLASDSVEEKVNHALLVFRLTRATAHGDEGEMTRRLGKPLDAQFLRRVVEAEMVYSLIKSDPSSSSSNSSSSSHPPRFPVPATDNTAGLSRRGSYNDSGENLADNNSGHPTHGPRESLYLGSSYFELTEDFFEGSAVGNGTVLQLVRSLCLCFLIAGELQCLRQLVRKLGPLTPLLFGQRQRKQRSGKSPVVESSSPEDAYSEDISAFAVGLSNDANALESALLETIMRLLLPAEKQQS